MGYYLIQITLWNRALLSRHIWDILSYKRSFWVRWVHGCFRASNFWLVRCSSKWSWTLVNLLKLRIHVRQFFLYQLGGGAIVNAWEDVWLPYGSLSEFLSFRFIYSQDFDSQTSARDIIHAFTDGWLNDWIARCPLLATIPFYLCMKPNRIKSI